MCPSPTSPEEARIVELVTFAVSEALKQLPQITVNAELARQVAVNNEQLETLVCKVDGMEHLLRGNGTPGLVSKIQVIEPLVLDHQKILRGEGDKPGMVARLDAIEKKAEAAMKPVWIVVSVVITSITTYLLSLFLQKP